MEVKKEVSVVTILLCRRLYIFVERRRRKLDSMSETEQRVQKMKVGFRL